MAPEPAQAHKVHARLPQKKNNEVRHAHEASYSHAFSGRWQPAAGQQLPISPIAHSTLHQPMRKSVLGFLISPFWHNPFYGVSNQP
ncbi:hypothetical protein D9M68_524020 [compost metagenome]